MQIVFVDRHASLAPPHYIQVPVPSQEREQSRICVSAVLILSLPLIFLWGFGTVSTVWYWLYFILSIR
jgi:hypothetical protein